MRRCDTIWAIMTFDLTCAIDHISLSGIPPWQFVVSIPPLYQIDSWSHLFAREYSELVVGTAILLKINQ